MNDISYVVPVYATQPEHVDMLVDCLASVREHSPEVDIVVVRNNGLPIKERLALLGLFDLYLEEPVQGYSPAVNRGLRAAAERANFVVIGSADAKFTAPWTGALHVQWLMSAVASPRHAKPDSLCGQSGFCGVVFGFSVATLHRVGYLDESDFRVRKGDQEWAVRADRLGITPTMTEAPLFEHVAPHHTKPSVGETRLNFEVEAFRRRFGAATYRRWKKLQQRGRAQ